jgi:hypothetical protein
MISVSKLTKNLKNLAKKFYSWPDLLFEGKMVFFRLLKKLATYNFFSTAEGFCSQEMVSAVFFPLTADGICSLQMAFVVCRWHL